MPEISRWTASTQVSSKMQHWYDMTSDRRRLDMPLPAAWASMSRRRGLDAPCKVLGDPVWIAAAAHLRVAHIKKKRVPR